MWKYRAQSNTLKAELEDIMIEGIIARGVARESKGGRS
jgi:hypothetical protein